MLLLEHTRKWFRNKPKGFGEGKGYEYDTSVEDKLFEECGRLEKPKLLT